jgi:simple sugar transport system ATP-binding protein
MPFRDLKYVVQAKARGLGVIFITHNVHHAWAVGDTFTVLNRGRSYGTFKKADTTREHLLQMMAGGEELEALAVELDLISKKDPTSAAQMEHQAAENLHQR